MIIFVGCVLFSRVKNENLIVLIIMLLFEGKEKILSFFIPPSVVDVFTKVLLLSPWRALQSPWVCQ